MIMIGFLVSGLLVLAIINLWLMIDKRKNYVFLFYFIPFFLLLTLSIYWTYTSILGMSKMGYPTKGMYLSHYVDEPEWIYLWILENQVPIAYKINYSKEDHEALEGVKMEAQQGEYMILSPSELKEDGVGEENLDDVINVNEGTGYTIGGDTNFYKWKYQGTSFQK